MKLVKMNKSIVKSIMKSAAVYFTAAAVIIAPSSAFASSSIDTDFTSGTGGIYNALNKYHWYNICSTYHNWYPDIDRPVHPCTVSDNGLVHKPFDGNNCTWNWGNGDNSDTGNSGQNSTAPSGYASEVFNLVNSQRSANGQSVLTYSTEAANVAQAKAEDMATNNYFSHTSPTYGSAFDMLKANGVSYSSAGENIAKGQTSSSSVMNAWMNSSGHRANILSSSYKSIGVGCAADSSGTLYWVQIFIG